MGTPHSERPRLLINNALRESQTPLSTEEIFERVASLAGIKTRMGMSAFLRAAARQGSLVCKKELSGSRYRAFYSLPKNTSQDAARGSPLTAVNIGENKFMRVKQVVTRDGAVVSMPHLSFMGG
jgi:hypothetical protein